METATPNLSQSDLLKLMSGGDTKSATTISVFLDFLKELQETLDTERLKSLLATGGEQGITENVDNVAFVMDALNSEFKVLMKVKPAELEQETLDLLTETGKTLASSVLKFVENIKNLPKHDTEPGSVDTPEDEICRYYSDGSESGEFPGEFPEE